MKKFFMILVVALAAMACVFASFDTKKLSVGVGAGLAGDTVHMYGRDTYYKGIFNYYGFDLAVRGDYEVKDNTFVTAVFNWEIDSVINAREKHDFFARYTKTVSENVDNEHMLGLVVGYTKRIPVGPVKVDLTAGPNVKISCNDGKFDLGVTGMLKCSYEIPKSSFTVDLTAATTALFVVGNKWYTEYSTNDVKVLFANGSIVLGCTYSF